MDWTQDIDLSRQGDAAAFGRIVTGHMPSVSRIALQIAGDLAAASDIAQETFIKAYRSLSALQDPRQLPAWLCGIARTTSIDWLRRNRKDALLDEASMEAAVSGSAARTQDRDILETVVAQETRQVVLQALDSLPPHYREALILKYASNLSYEEIARAIHASVPAVESLLFRGRVMLREKLDHRFRGETAP